MILLPWFSRQGSAPGSSNVRPALTTVRVSGPFNQTRRDARFRRSRGPFYKSRSARLADLISEADQTYDLYPASGVVERTCLRSLEPGRPFGVKRLHALAEVVGLPQPAVAVTFELDRKRQGRVFGVVEQLLRRALRQRRKRAQLVDQRIGC